MKPPRTRAPLKYKATYLLYLYAQRQSGKCTPTLVDWCVLLAPALAKQYLASLHRPDAVPEAKGLNA